MPLFGRHKMTDAVEGSARVVNVNTIPNVSDLAQRCALDVVVEAPGIAAFVASITVRVNSNRWPSRDQLLPVLIDRADPEHIEVLWDRVPTFEELRQRAHADRLAKAVAATGAPVSPAVTSTAPGSAAHVLEAGLPAQVIVRNAPRLGMQNLADNPQAVVIDWGVALAL